MTFPTIPVVTTNLDADTDDPRQARLDLLDLIQKFNDIVSNVSAFGASVLDDLDAAAMRATFGAAQAFPAGTALVFAQTAAPTGWTKSTTHNDKALRVVSGAAASGGATGFTSVFGASKTAGATTLSTAQMPSHQHTFSGSTGGQSVDHSHTMLGTDGSAGGGYPNPLVLFVPAGTGLNNLNASTTGVSADHSHTLSGSTDAAGSGSSHNHTLSLDLQYTDVTIAIKD